MDPGFCCAAPGKDAFFANKSAPFPADWSDSGRRAGTQRKMCAVGGIF
jgi:hypothetical protein